MTRSSRRIALAVLAGTAAVALSACHPPSVTNATLPGGKAATGPANHYTVYLHDALDLVPQSAVHNNDVIVGTVEKVSLCETACGDPKHPVDGPLAKVQLRVLKSVTLPSNVQATLGQTSLLGEKYISLDVPSGTAPSTTQLTDNTVVDTPSDANKENQQQLEDVFGALSALLNGGGVAQLQQINIELAKVLSGREGTVRDLLKQFTALTGNLDQHRDEVVRALTAVDKLAQQLAQQRDTIATALDKIAPGLEVLSTEEKDLVKLLGGLDHLGVVAKRVIHETQADALHDLQAIQPTLARFNQAGTDIAKSLELLLSFPFGDDATKTVPGDYTGLYVTLNLDLTAGSPANPLSPNGPLCGGLPIPISIPKPPFCSAATTSAGSAQSSSAKAHTPTGAKGAATSAASGDASTAATTTAPTGAGPTGQNALALLLGGLLR